MPERPACKAATVGQNWLMRSFVIVGRSSNALIPLAETIDFRFHKNELAVQVNDAKRETKFDIKDMVMRSEWDRVQRHIEEKLKESDDEAEVLAALVTLAEFTSFSPQRRRETERSEIKRLFCVFVPVW